MSTTQQLQQQKSVIDQYYRNRTPYNGHVITEAEYNQWNTNYNQQYAAAQARESARQQNPPAATYYTRTPSGIKPESQKPPPIKKQTVQKQPTPQTVNAQQQEAYYYKRTEAQANVQAKRDIPDISSKLPSGAVITGYNPQTKDVSYRTAEQDRAYQESMRFYTKVGFPEYGGKYAPLTVPVGFKVAGVKEVAVPFMGPVKDESKRPSYLSLEFSLERTGELTPLEQAKQLEDTREFASFGSGSQQGTATSGLSREQIIANLSEVDKQAFKMWQQEKINTSMVNMGVFFAAGLAAPIIGPTAAVEAAVIGVGATQGIKSAETVLMGGDVRGSLLSPEEAVFAAEGGIIFSGVGRGVMAGVKAFAPKAISSTVSAEGFKGAFSRAGINAGLGGGASYILSGGDLIDTAKGAAFGATFSLGFEAAGVGYGRLKSAVGSVRSIEVPKLFGRTGRIKTEALIVDSEAIFTMRSFGVKNSLSQYSRVPSGNSIRSVEVESQKNLSRLSMQSSARSGQILREDFLRENRVESTTKLIEAEAQSNLRVIQPTNRLRAKDVVRNSSVLIGKGKSQKQAFNSANVLVPKAVRQTTQFKAKSAASQFQLSMPKMTQAQTERQMLKALQMQSGDSMLKAKSKATSALLGSNPKRGSGRLSPTLPSLGGGEGKSGGPDLLWGKWGKKKRKIKTYQQMLKTFELDGAAKGLSKVERSLGKMDKQARRLNKAFIKPRNSKRKVRRRKR